MRNNSEKGKALLIKIVLFLGVVALIFIALAIFREMRARKQIQTEIESIISRSNHTAEHQMMDIVSMAAIQMEQTLTSEVVRLEALKKVNPSIRKDEIDFFKQLIVESKLSLSNATLKLQGLRVVINK